MSIRVLLFSIFTGFLLAAAGPALAQGSRIKDVASSRPAVITS